MANETTLPGHARRDPAGNFTATPCPLVGGRPESPADRPGARYLRDPLLNKGTAFTEAERDALGLRGLLPPRVQGLGDQVARALENLRRKTTDLERHIYLQALHDRNATLFYRLLVDHLEELTPLVYTPVVGEGCREYSSIWRRPRGLFISADDRGRVRELMGNWPGDGVRVIVVTDGERILGLGDLGANGMGICVGKLALYTACAGIPPAACLPVTLDVGTDHPGLLADPLYLGLQRPRLRGPAYDALVEEFMRAAADRFPGALIQFEDFGNRNAFRLLERYRERYCTFNDDIQGTAAVALAGLLAALRLTGGGLEDQKILFLGAGEAGCGIGGLVVAALKAAGLSDAQARERCWFVDSKGLVVSSRGDLEEHKRPFAHPHPFLPDFRAAVETLRPTAIIGVSGMAGGFGRPVLEAMARCHARPIVFALSNPTSKAECTAAEAYGATGGRAIFASGSPFAPVPHERGMLVPGQGNNAYIFPGLGLGVLASGAPHITEAMFLEAARALAGQVDASDLAQGRVYPAFSRIREVSVAIACAVADCARREGLAPALGNGPVTWEPRVRSLMWEPRYREYAA